MDQAYNKQSVIFSWYNNLISYIFALEIWNYVA